MSTYFFHIDDGTPPLSHEAVEAESLADAKCLAVKLAGQSICDAAGDFWAREEWRLTATDETGLSLFSLHFVGFDSPAAVGARHPGVISATPIVP